MNDQKRENLLNLALDATDAERAASSSLGTGYDFSTGTWEVIVRYQGDISFLEESGVRITYLLFQYAILLLPEQLMDDVTNLPQITYMEKPKRLFFADFAGRSISCIHSLQEGPRGLFGDGTLLACIDSGVDYTHPAFRNADGSSRLLALWDQTIPGSPPEGYPLGTLYTRQQINEALNAADSAERNRMVPSRDTSGHGTAVLGIAAGGGGSERGGGEDSLYRGVAPKAALLAVKKMFAAARRLEGGGSLTILATLPEDAQIADACRELSAAANAVVYLSAEIAASGIIPAVDFTRSFSRRADALYGAGGKARADALLALAREGGTARVLKELEKETGAEESAHKEG